MQKYVYKRGYKVAETFFIFNFLAIVISIPLGLLYLSLVQIPKKKYGVVTAKWLPWSVSKDAPYCGQAFVPSWENGIWTRILKTGWRFLFLYKIWGSVHLEDIPFCREGRRFMYIAQAGKAIPNGRPMVVENFNPEKGEDFLMYATRGPLAVLGSPGYHNVFGYVLKDGEDRPPDGKLYLFHIKLIEPITIGSVPRKGLNPHNPDEEIQVPQMGLVTSKVGNLTLGEGVHKDEQIVARMPCQCVVDGISYNTHDNFMDPIAFILMGGEMGLQRDIMEPGGYFLHPVAFDVEIVDAVVVTEGRRAVLVSRIGSGADEGGADYVNRHANDGDTDPNTRVPVLKPEFDPREADKEYRRGILSYTYGPGSYFINPYILRAIIIDTTPQHVEGTFDAMSKEYYDLKVPVSIRFKIAPEDAPLAVAVSGSIDELIKDTIFPELEPAVVDVFSKSGIDEIMGVRKTITDEINVRMEKVLKTRFVKLIKFLVSKPDGSGDAGYVAYDNLNARKKFAVLERETLEIEEVTEEKRVKVEKQKALAQSQRILAEAELREEAAPKNATAIEARNNAMNYKDGEGLTNLAKTFGAEDITPKLAEAFIQFISKK
jgi:hypothetical protein